MVKKQKKDSEKSKQKVSIQKTIKKGSTDKQKIIRTLSIQQTIKESNFVPAQKQQNKIIAKQQIQISNTEKAKKINNSTKQKKILNSIKKQQKQSHQVLKKPDLQNQKQKIIKRTSSFEGNKFQQTQKEQFINLEILNEKTHQLDEFYNFKEKFLGKEGAFKNYKVLIGYLSAIEYCGGFDAYPGVELKKRGFQYDIVYTVSDLNKKMLDYDIIWILSFGQTSIEKEQTEFLDKIEKCMKAKKSLFLWSDDDPLFWYTNQILQKFFNGMEMKGNYFGNQIINKSSDNFQKDKKGKFDGTHSIFYGVNNLHEGITICHPEQIHSDFKVIAYNSNNEPLVLIAEENENHGRIILDTGFTKLYQQFWSLAGTHQYVSNANVWLTGIPD